jgi:hypothetical protein
MVLPVQVPLSFSVDHCTDEPVFPSLTAFVGFPRGDPEVLEGCSSQMGELPFQLVPSVGVRSWRLPRKENWLAGESGEDLGYKTIVNIVYCRSIGHDFSIREVLHEPTLSTTWRYAKASSTFASTFVDAFSTAWYFAGFRAWRLKGGFGSDATMVRCGFPGLSIRSRRSRVGRLGEAFAPRTHGACQGIDNVLELL